MESAIKQIFEEVDVLRMIMKKVEGTTSLRDGAIRFHEDAIDVKDNTELRAPHFDVYQPFARPLMASRKQTISLVG